MVTKYALTLLDFLLPPLCPLCGEPTVAADTLCPSCWPSVTFISEPMCACCGVPFELEETAPDGLICGACASSEPEWRKARSALMYDEAAKRILLPFKHADRLDLAGLQAKWLSAAGGALLQEADLIIPVPLHRLRLFRRRYNQAGLLAGRLSRLSGVPVAYDVLLRTRRTKSQGAFGRLGRSRNVAAAFQVPQTRRAKVKGRRCVLVDDVLTTGATVATCAKTLKKAGAAHVDVLTVARVAR